MQRVILSGWPSGLDLSQLEDRHAKPGPRPECRANAGDKMLTLVAPALAGGDCIDDADGLRTGGTRWRHRGGPTAWSRRRPPWGPSCAVSGGDQYANWTG